MCTPELLQRKHATPAREPTRQYFGLVTKIIALWTAVRAAAEAAAAADDGDHDHDHDHDHDRGLLKCECPHHSGHIGLILRGWVRLRGV